MKEIVSKFEKESGKILLDPSELSVHATQQEFDELTSDMTKWRGVVYDDRIAFLERNGYEVIRENLTADLSAKPPEEEQNG